MVLISLTHRPPVSLSLRKSTRATPEQPRAWKVATAQALHLGGHLVGDLRRAAALEAAHAALIPAGLALAAGEIFVSVTEDFIGAGRLLAGGGAGAFVIAQDGAVDFPQMFHRPFHQDPGGKGGGQVHGVPEGSPVLCLGNAHGGSQGSPA